jgi:hypothetical protein
VLYLTSRVALAQQGSQVQDDEQLEEEDNGAPEASQLQPADTGAGLPQHRPRRSSAAQSTAQGGNLGCPDCCCLCKYIPAVTLTGTCSLEELTSSFAQPLPMIWHCNTQDLGGARTQVHSEGGG